MVLSGKGGVRFEDDDDGFTDDEKSAGGGGGGRGDGGNAFNQPGVSSPPPAWDPEQIPYILLAYDLTFGVVDPSMKPSDVRKSRPQYMQYTVKRWGDNYRNLCRKYKAKTLGTKEMYAAMSKLDPELKKKGDDENLAAKMARKFCLRVCLVPSLKATTMKI